MSESESFMERLRARMGSGGDVNSVRPYEGMTRGERNLVRTGAWDKRSYREEARPLRPIDNLIYDLTMGDKHTNREGLDPGPELVEGLFHLFHKAAPSLTPKRAVLRELYPAHRILEEMAKHPRLTELQDHTMNDLPMAAMAVGVMGDIVKEMLERAGQVPPPMIPQPGEGGGDGDQSGQSQPQQQPGGDEESDEEGPDDGENQWEKDFDEALSGIDLDKLVDDAISDAVEETSELENLRKSIGCDDGEWRTMDPEKRMEMAEFLRTPEMKALAWVVGQMKRFALGIKAIRVHDVPHVMYDVELGNNLRLILSSQYALLGNVATKVEFYRKYAMKQLLIKKKRGTAEVSKGPIVVCIDRSGSMDGAPMRWAMGVSEALRQFALEDDRDFHAIFFSTNNDRTHFDFPGGKASIDQVLDFLSVDAGGAGTDFDGVLDEAVEFAATAYDEEKQGKADVVFVTDGMAELSEEWISEFNAERTRVGVRVFSVYIGGARDMGGRTGPLGLLKKISDATIPVRELKPQAVREIFEKV